jgi:hypothetical protein
MKLKLFFSSIIIAVFFAACNNADNKAESTTNADSVSQSPKTMLTVTKQYVTNGDGTVTELAINAEIGYNEKEVSVNFKDSADKSFTVNIASMEKKVEGVYLIPKDRKYKEIFVSSGSQPQVTFSSDKGSGNMTFM